MKQFSYYLDSSFIKKQFGRTNREETEVLNSGQDSI
jgi:hypothetical protein